MSRPFTPTPGFGNPHLQTLYGSLFAARPEMAYRRERWDTDDGDFVDVDFIDGPAGTPWVHMFHGLEGSSGSPYAKHLMSLTKQRGWRGSVFNFRGCSGEPNRLPRAYHSGDTPEVEWALSRLKALAGDVPFYAAGVSLGGNVLLKWLGEQGEAAKSKVTRAAAISAPVDLTAAGYALSTGFANFYGQHFLGTLRKRSHAKLMRFPGIFDHDKAKAARTLREFDDVVTAPVHGFNGVDDYYTRASSKPWLTKIRVPTLLLNARDDPFLPERFLPRADEVSDAVTIEFPKRGGHVGFVSGFPGRIDWLPNRLMHFFEQGA